MHYLRELENEKNKACFFPQFGIKIVSTGNDDTDVKITFSPSILWQGSNFVQTIPRRGSSFMEQKKEKKKSVVFVVENP